MRMNILWIDVADILPDPGNVRHARDAEADAELTASIAKLGVLQPLRVYLRNGKYFLRTGHRRFDAACAAGLKQVPVLVVDDAAAETELLLEQLAENRHRKDLCPLDEARAFQRAMQSAQWTAARLAQELGVAPSKVTRLLALLALPDDVQSLIAAGRIGPSVGYEIGKIADPALQRSAAERAAQGLVTRDRLVAEQSHGVAPTTGPRALKIACPLSGGAVVTLSLPGAVALADAVPALEAALREVRKAVKQGLDPATLTRLLRDRARGASSSKGDL